MQNVFFISGTIVCIVFTLYILYSIYIVNKQNKKINSYLEQDSKPMWKETLEEDVKPAWKEIKIKTEPKKEVKKKRHYHFSCQWIKAKGDTFYWLFAKNEIDGGWVYITISTKRTKWKDKSYMGKLNRFLNKYGKMLNKKEYLEERRSAAEAIIKDDIRAERLLKYLSKIK